MSVKTCSYSLFPITGKANQPISKWVGFFAPGTDCKLAAVFFIAESMRYSYALGATDACPRGLGLVEQARKVLLLFGFELEKPGPDLGPLFELSRVNKDTDPVPCFFVVECEGITPDVDHAEPSIAEGTGGKELNGIGQALGCFTEGIEESSLGKMPVCLIHHETPDKYAHSLEPME